MLMHFLQERTHCLATLAHIECQQLGSEVERQGKGNKSTTPRTALSFLERKKSCPGSDSDP